MRGELPETGREVKSGTLNFIGNKLEDQLPAQSMKMVAGCSSESLSAWIIDAASKPSTKR